MKKDKTPAWVLEKQNLNKKVHEDVIVVGKMGADGVVDGLLPDGTKYQWEKIRNGHL
jgi:hypothetical protein